MLSCRLPPSPPGAFHTASLRQLLQCFFFFSALCVSALICERRMHTRRALEEEEDEAHRTTVPPTFIAQGVASLLIPGGAASSPAQPFCNLPGRRASVSTRLEEVGLRGWLPLIRKFTWCVPLRGRECFIV